MTRANKAAPSLFLSKLVQIGVLSSATRRIFIGTMGMRMSGWEKLEFRSDTPRWALPPLRLSCSDPSQRQAPRPQEERQNDQTSHQVIFVKSTSSRYILQAIKHTYFKCIVQQYRLVPCVTPTTTKMENVCITQRVPCGPPSSASAPPPARQPLICFLSPTVRFRSLGFHMQPFLSIRRFHICELVYLLKFICNLQISTHGAFVVIHRHVQSGENFSAPEAHAPS